MVKSHESAQIFESFIGKEFALKYWYFTVSRLKFETSEFNQIGCTDFHILTNLLTLSVSSLVAGFSYKKESDTGLIFNLQRTYED